MGSRKTVSISPVFHRRSHRGTKGSHKHAGDTQKDVSSAPPAKVARADTVSPPKSSTNGSSRTVHTLPAEEQADNIEDENFQVSFLPLVWHDKQ